LLDPGTAISTANAQVGAANAYVSALASAAAGFDPPRVNVDVTLGARSPELLDLPTLPKFLLPTLPAGDGPSDLDVTALTPVAFPTFNGIAPTFEAGTAPTDEAFTIPDMPPVAAIGGVGSLSVALPAVPSLLSIDIATFDGVSLPTFDGGAIPEMTLVRPSVTPYTPGTLYNSALFTAVRTSLQDRIENGGTGLAANIEQAIFDRAREREIRTVQDAIDGLERMETMGFAFPPGVYLDSRLKIQTEYGKVEAGLSRDIMIKQAELELSNVQEALKLAIAAEGQFMDYTSKVEQRIFEATKYATEAAVQIYNAEVQAYAAKLDAYKTTVQIYEARIRGELAKVEVYKARVAAEQTKAEVNTAIVQQYKVQVDAALSNVEVFKAQVQGVLAAAQIEQVKVQAYAEQIKAYGAKANIFTARVEAYKARMQAEGFKQDAYKSTVEAFVAQTNAAAAQANVQIEQVKVEADVYKASWEGYKARFAAAGDLAQAMGAVNAATANAYGSYADAIGAFNNTLTAQWKAQGEMEARGAEIGVAVGKVNAELLISMRSLALDAAKVGAQVSAQIAAAALNTMNYSNSISSGESFSFSNSNSTSDNNNVNTNL
jgi:hypothetical protein